MWILWWTFNSPLCVNLLLVTVWTSERLFASIKSTMPFQFLITIRTDEWLFTGVNSTVQIQFPTVCELYYFWSFISFMKTYISFIDSTFFIKTHVSVIRTPKFIPGETHFEWTKSHVYGILLRFLWIKISGVFRGHATSPALTKKSA